MIDLRNNAQQQFQHIQHYKNIKIFLNFQEKLKDVSNKLNNLEQRKMKLEAQIGSLQSREKNLEMVRIVCVCVCLCVCACMCVGIQDKKKDQIRS